MEFICWNDAFEAYLVIILENISVESFYYQIHENFPPQN